MSGLLRKLSTWSKRASLGVALAIPTLIPSLANGQEKELEEIVAEENESKEDIKLKIAGRVATSPHNSVGSPSLDNYMLMSNSYSVYQLTNAALKYTQLEDQGILGVFERIGHVSLSFYLDEMLSISVHEFGHFSEYNSRRVRRLLN